MIGHRITDHKKKGYRNLNVISWLFTWRFKISIYNEKLSFMKGCLPNRNVYLYQTTGWHFFQAPLSLYILYIQTIYSSNLSLQYIFVSAGTDVKHIEFREEWQFRFKHQKDSGKFSKIFKIFQGITIHIG